MSYVTIHTVPGHPGERKVSCVTLENTYIMPCRYDKSIKISIRHYTRKTIE